MTASLPGPVRARHRNGYGAPSNGAHGPLPPALPWYVDPAVWTPDSAELDDVSELLRRRRYIGSHRAVAHEVMMLLHHLGWRPGRESEKPVVEGIISGPPGRTPGEGS